MRCSHLVAEIVLFKSTVKPPYAQIVFVSKTAAKIFKQKIGGGSYICGMQT